MIDLKKLRTTAEDLEFPEDRALMSDAADEIAALRDLNRNNGEVSARTAERCVKAEAERDQLAAEMAEARKTVEGLTKQVAALVAACRLPRFGISTWTQPKVTGDSVQLKCERHGICYGSCATCHYERIDAQDSADNAAAFARNRAIDEALAGTAAVAAGSVSDETTRLRHVMQACVDAHEAGSTVHGINLMRSVLAERGGA